MPPGPFKRLFVFDHGLGPLSGHWLHFEQLVYAQARARGMDARIFSHRHVQRDLTGDLPVDPLFRTGPADRLSEHPSKNMKLRNRAFLRDLRSLRRADFAPSDLFLFPCVMNHELAAVLHFARDFPRKTRPVFLLLLQFDNGLGAPGEDDLDLPAIVRFDRYLKRLLTRRASSSGVAALYRRAFRSGGGHVPRTVFMAPSGGMNDRIAELLNVVVWPYCMPGPTPCEMGVTGPMVSSGGQLTVAYLGPACFRKGAHLLPEVMKNVSQSHTSVRFHIQVSFEPGTHLEHLFQEPPPGTAYHRGHLTREQYYHLARLADVVLLPYCPNAYRYMPSGVLREAIALGKVVVVPAGTSLERQARSVDAAAVLFAEQSATAVAGALDAALLDLPALKRKAAEAAPRWVEQHNPRRFMNQLLDRAAEAAC